MATRTKRRGPETAAQTVGESEGGGPGDADRADDSGQAESTQDDVRRRLDDLAPLLNLNGRPADGTFIEADSLASLLRVLGVRGVPGCVLGRLSDRVLWIDPDRIEDIRRLLLKAGVGMTEVNS